MRKPRPVHVFDTVTLSNFALAGHFELLVTRYGQGALITPAVLDEVTDGIVAGYTALRAIEEAVEKGRICLSAAIPSAAERQTYRELLRVLAPGEASCVANAQACGGVVVTDDRTARQCCIERDITFTGTIGILKACCMDGTLPPEAADDTLQPTFDAGYYSPVHSISDLL